MPEWINTEILTILLSSIGGIVTFFTLLWKKLINPLVKLIKNHDVFIESVNELRKELTTNGGNSLKDAIIELKSTCHRIEKRQKIIEQRTKAGLHYSNIPLFETDNDGRLIWNNVHFGDLIKNTINSIEGYDWLNIIEEDQREEVLNEFRSCLKMNRRFSKETGTQDGRKIRLMGYPYRITDVEHGGFLVSVSETK
jgi:hypothetical protein